MKKRRIIIGLLLILAVIPVAVWRLTIPAVPVSFTGDAPPGRFAALSEFDGKPIIDIKLPGGSRWVYPKKRKLAHKGVDHDAICGYWEVTEPLNDRTREVRLVIGGQNFDPMLSDAETSTSPLPAAPIAVAHSLTVYGTYSRAEGNLIALPYVTDAKYANAKLELRGKTYDVILPVRAKDGAKGRKTTTVKAGPYQLDFKPTEWRTSYGDMGFVISMPKTKGRYFNLMVERYQPTWGSTGSVSFAQVFDFDRGMMNTNLSRTAKSKITGRLVELAPSPVKLIVTRSKDIINLRDPKTNKVLFGSGGGYYHGGNGGYTAFSYKGLTFGNMRMVAPQSLKEAFAKIPSGAEVDLIGYKTVGRHEFSGELDVPPPLKIDGPYPMYSFISRSIAVPVKTSVP